MVPRILSLLCSILLLSIPSIAVVAQVSSSSHNLRITKPRDRRLLDRADDHAYLIRYHDDTNDLFAKAAMIVGGTLRHIHASHNAIAVHNITDIDAVLADDADIWYIEPDGIVYASSDNATTNSNETDYYTSQDLNSNTTDYNETLPLDWLDGTLDNSYHYAYTGQGVKVYIIDSGMDASHGEFLSHNITCGLDLRTTDCDDTWGHGTHIAATIGGTTFGVAKDTELIAIKVLADDGTARFSDVIAGLEHVYHQHVNSSERAVVHLSLGTSRVAKLLNAAVEQLVDMNVVVVAAAGNGRTDACSWSPASAESIIAVAALDREFREIVPSSNYGNCISMYAPGDWIYGAWHNGTQRSVTGTSMAAPFVTGTVALYLERNGNLTVAELKAALQNDARQVYLSQRNETVLAVCTRSLLLPENHTI